MMAESFLSPRRCLLEPIQEILEAARLLDQAANAHLVGDTRLAQALIRQADMPAIAGWTDSIWGRHNQDVLRIRMVAGAPPVLPLAERPRPRAPTSEAKRAIVKRDGYHCRFCGIAVIDKTIRTLLRGAYPDALRWGRSNAEQHAAFQCMWLQYDHVLPNGRGGASSEDNLVVTCAPCNFGRMERTLDEVGLKDPRLNDIKPSKWDGLERIRTWLKVSA
jgi:hypothetical protein